MISTERIFSKSFLAGLSIGIAGYIYLSTPNAILSTILFSVGLLSCIITDSPLFTGKSGFLSDSLDFRRLFIVLIFNILGASLLGLLSGLVNNQIQEAANIIVTNRLETPILKLILNSTITGFLMTLAVESEKNNKHSSHIPLIICIMAFIIGGCYHSIADSFYYSANLNTSNIDQVLLRLSITILFNFLGCNLYNLCLYRSLFSTSPSK